MATALRPVLILTLRHCELSWNRKFVIAVCTGSDHAVKAIKDLAVQVLPEMEIRWSD
jgi:hypothetical protein